MSEEIWKPIIINGNDTGYQVSDKGNTKNKSGENIGFIDEYGYRQCTINQKRKRQHRLVLSAFNPIENMKDMDVHHKDGIKTNNKLENLVWMDKREHIILEQELGNLKIGKKGKESLTYKGSIGQFNKQGVLENIFLGKQQIEKNNFNNRGVYATTLNRSTHHKGYIFRRFPKNEKPEIGKTYNLYDPMFTQFFKYNINKIENTQMEMKFS
jgi:hypothetical protein